MIHCWSTYRNNTTWHWLYCMLPHGHSGNCQPIPEDEVKRMLGLEGYFDERIQRAKEVYEEYHAGKPQKVIAVETGLSAGRVSGLVAQYRSWLDRRARLEKDRTKRDSIKELPALVAALENQGYGSELGSLWSDQNFVRLKEIVALMEPTP